MPGNEPLVIYRISGQTPLLPDERALPSATWQSGDGTTLRLVAGAHTAAGVIRLRWVVDHTANAADASATTDTPLFEMQAQTATGNNASTPVRAGHMPANQSAARRHRLHLGNDRLERHRHRFRGNRSATAGRAADTDGIARRPGAVAGTGGAADACLRGRRVANHSPR